MAELDDLSALRIEREPLDAPSGGWVKWVVLLIVLAAAGGGAWYFLTGERPVQVEAAGVTERAAGTQASVLNASGYVTARRRATVSSKVTGKVIEVNVEEGMDVREGQVLARLDDSTLQAGLRLYRAQLEASKRQIPESDVRLAQARVQLQRQERLRKEGLNTPNDIDNAKAEVDSLAARYSDAQTYTMDGVSVEYPDWHFNVRASNTEPLIRLNLEATTEQKMAQKRDEVLAFIRS